MIEYIIHGSLPSMWEDFICQTDGYPSISIYKNEKYNTIDIENNWIDISLTDKKPLTLHEALNILSENNDNKNVSLKQLNLIKSV